MDSSEVETMDSSSFVYGAICFGTYLAFGSRSKLVGPDSFRPALDGWSAMGVDMDFGTDRIWEMAHKTIISLRYCVY